MRQHGKKLPLVLMHPIVGELENHMVMQYHLHDEIHAHNMS